jgi:hypothetical protein
MLSSYVSLELYYRLALSSVYLGPYSSIYLNLPNTYLVSPPFRYSSSSGFTVSLGRSGRLFVPTVYILRTYYLRPSYGR